MIHKVWMTKYEVKNIQLCIMTTNRLILAKGRENTHGKRINYVYCGRGH
jgi:hypothetical protein